MQGIYLITNLINGKKYVGQSRDICKRFKKHIASTKEPTGNNYTTIITQALIKYGVENFSFVILEFVEDRLLLNERELYWINYFDCWTHKALGYNVQIPDHLGFWNVRPVQQLDLNNNVLRTFDSIAEAQRQTGFYHISRVCK